LVAVLDQQVLLLRVLVVQVEVLVLVETTKGQVLLAKVFRVVTPFITLVRVAVAVLPLLVLVVDLILVVLVVLVVLLFQHGQQRHLLALAAFMLAVVLADIKVADLAQLDQQILGLVDSVAVQERAMVLVV
jgi:hypothetical protein